MSAILPMRLRGKPYRVMIFVDGENIAIRIGDELGDRQLPEHVSYKKDIYAWSNILNKALEHYEVTRICYYTSATGSTEYILEIENELRKFGVDSPNVFKKERKAKKTKQVDIALVTDLLKHAYLNNYDIAILVTGDEDFVPAVRSVTDAGKTVILWHTETGISENLRRCSHFSFNLSKVLLEEESEAWSNVFHKT